MAAADLTETATNASLRRSKFLLSDFKSSMPHPMCLCIRIMKEKLASPGVSLSPPREKKEEDEKFPRTFSQLPKCFDRSNAVCMDFERLSLPQHSHTTTNQPAKGFLRVEKPKSLASLGQFIKRSGNSFDGRPTQQLFLAIINEISGLPICVSDLNCPESPLDNAPNFAIASLAFSSDFRALYNYASWVVVGLFQ